MKDYVRIGTRYERFEEISNLVSELEQYAPTGKIKSSVEYPRGYKGSVDGFVILEIGDFLPITENARRILNKILEDREQRGSYEVSVEMTIQHENDSAKIIFRVPDIYEYMDEPEDPDETGKIDLSNIKPEDFKDIPEG